MKKYKVKVTKWFLDRMSNGKLPVKVKDKTELIGKGDEVITDNIQGIEDDPRYDIKDEQAEEKIEKKKKKEADVLLTKEEPKASEGINTLKKLEIKEG